MPSVAQRAKDMETREYAIVHINQKKKNVMLQAFRKHKILKKISNKHFYKNVN